MIISFVSCQTKEKEKAMLVFDDIQQFPQEIIITQFSENFVNQTDTFKIGNKKKLVFLLELTGQSMYMSKKRDKPSSFS